jgi:hypothetical protein
MADPILLTNRVGYVVAEETDHVLGAIQEFGNFRNATNPNAPGQPTFEESARLGYTADGNFSFSGFALSIGQHVRFDLALGRFGAYATNVRVP